MPDHTLTEVILGFISLTVTLFPNRSGDWRGEPPDGERFVVGDTDTSSNVQLVADTDDDANVLLTCDTE